MTAVIRHFGDTADAHRPCGKCDFCSPSTTSAQTFAEPTTAQARDLRTILAALAHAPSRATGKLLHRPRTRHRPQTIRRPPRRPHSRRPRHPHPPTPSPARKTAAAIPYKKASLTHEGRSPDASELAGVVLPATSSEPVAAPTRSRKRSGSRASRPIPVPSEPISARAPLPAIPLFQKQPRKRLQVSQAFRLGPLRQRKQRGFSPWGTLFVHPTEFHRTRPAASDPTDSLTPDQLLLDAQLRAWRKAESERMGLPNSSSSAPPRCAALCSCAHAPSLNSRPSPASAPTRRKNSARASSISAPHSLRPAPLLRCAHTQNC